MLFGMITIWIGALATETARSSHNLRIGTLSESTTKDRRYVSPDDILLRPDPFPFSWIILLNSLLLGLGTTLRLLTSTRLVASYHQSKFVKI